MTTRLVVLDGGAPWGFRIHGGIDQHQPLKISRVNPGSKAALRGIREGDVITSINGQSTRDISNAEAHGLLKHSGDLLKLGLNENNDGTTPKRRQYKTVHQETHSETLKRSSTSSYSLTTSKIVSETEITNKEANPTNTNEPTHSSTSTYCTEPGDNSDTMSDNGTKTSRSKRKRFRKKHHNYRVESPEAKKLTKSKSLDDLEDNQPVITIQEVENDGIEDKNDTIAIVSEAESELEQDPLLEEISVMSPEEELTLRHFLEGLNLVNSPEDAAKQAYETSTIENVKTRRAKKRAAIEQYFSPMLQQPRFLDVINEESSDLSDRDVPKVDVKHLKQGTPELELPPRPPKSRRKLKKINRPVTFVAKVIESPEVLHGVLMEPSEPEVIYLDSSGSDSPEAKSDEENAQIPSETASNVVENPSENTSNVQIPSDTTSNVQIPSETLIAQIPPEPSIAHISSEPSAVQIPSETSNAEKSSESSAAQNQSKASQIPQNLLPEGEEKETEHIQKHFSITVKKNDVFVTKTETKSCEFEIRNNFDNKVLTELTPPPTPDEMSPKNGLSTKIDVSTISTLVTDNQESPEDTLSCPLPSRSPSLSSDSSSRATSLCTIKTNPMNSSIGDMASLTKDEELSKQSPKSLREICVNFLMLQPFGTDILQELADVATSIETFTNNLSGRFNVPELREKVVGNVENSVEEENKVWGTVQEDSKGQWSVLRVSSADDPMEADLHANFINSKLTSPHSVKKHADNVKIIAITDRNEEEPSQNMEGDARLKAKDLNEWLQLARVKHATNNILTNKTHQNHSNTLPQDLLNVQMQQLLEKEREIQRELAQIEEEKLFLTNRITTKFNVDDFHISKREDFAEQKPRPMSMPTEFFRQQMYEEYMCEVAARQERKQHKLIKVTSTNESETNKTATVGIENEFMDTVKRKQESGKLQTGDDPKRTPSPGIADDSNGVLVVDGSSVKEVTKLPKHLREFIDITKESTENEDSPDDGVWSPGQSYKPERPQEYRNQRDEPITPIWTPKSANSSPVLERKEFKPVKFESPVFNRKNYPLQSDQKQSESDSGLNLTLDKRIPSSHSSPASGFHLPKAQNPTITLLQKAREGQLPRGAAYIDPEPNYKLPHYNDRATLESQYRTRSDYTSESESDHPKKRIMSQRPSDGIYPTTRDGMPLILRSEVKDADQSKWYKKMYDTIHKQRPHRDEYVTVRYKQRRGQYPYTSGYLSEPEPGAYDSDYADKYATLDRRRVPVREKENNSSYAIASSATLPRNTTMETKSSNDLVKHTLDQYQNKPGKIENYQPGKASSIYDKEAKRWWDEVMDIFDGQLEHQQQKRQQLHQLHQPQSKSFINQALKESGYESDSTLVFRRKEDAALQLSPQDQKLAYKEIQRGGDIPLHGLRKPAPERPKEPEPPTPPPKGQHTIRNLQVNTESPRKYVENEVTIHYKTPVRHEIKDYMSEDELAHRQAENMKKLYQEERRRKYLQELQDMNNRRHTDNFIPSQKSPISLNRYDDFEADVPGQSATLGKPRPRSPETRLLARALYNFVGQSARELTFRKGDTIYVRRQVDKNWYEGELNAMIGLFPVNYVEIIPYDSAISTPRKPHEGQARAKFNFVAQTHLELSLAKGELVVITRRVDDNWLEGKIGGRKGIFPISYVDLLIEPSEPLPASTKPVASPAAHSLLINGTASGRDSMGSHSYTPILTSSTMASSNSGSVHARPVQIVSNGGTSGTYGTVGRSSKSPVNQALHIETQSETIPYRALYKYLPQNDDELELLEGDVVYVLEKCDDGWFVGSSDRTGAFGTFPGNYVEKI